MGSHPEFAGVCWRRFRGHWGVQSDRHPLYDCIHLVTAPVRNTTHLQCDRVQINGMTCTSCEVIIERKLKKLSGVQEVEVKHATGACAIYTSPNTTLKLSDIQRAIASDGYTVTLAISTDRSTRHAVSGTAPQRTNWKELGGILIVVLAMAALLKSWNIGTFSPTVGQSLSLGAVFLIGLIASTTTCAAIVGGLVLSAAAKYNELHPTASSWQKLRPHLLFNIGRIVSYVVLGGVIGVIGQAIAPSPRLTGVLTIFIAVIMLLLGVDMLKLFQSARWIPRMPKLWSHWIHTLAESDKPWVPLALGGLTFFLPCGFTQSVQLYALTTGSFWQGALTMGVFALGTMPALMGIGAISSVAKGNSMRHFMKFAGVVVLLLGVLNVSAGFTLLGVTFGTREGADAAVAAERVGEKQIVTTTVAGYKYSPEVSTIQKGVPVEWHVDGERAQGCALSMAIPALGISEQLSRSEETVIEFTPTRTGTLAFTCSMGMTSGQFNVIE